VSKLSAKRAEFNHMKDPMG